MSSYAGELFVKVTPDATGFDQQLAAQTKGSGSGASTLAKQYAQSAREIETSFKRAGQQIDKTLFASATTRAKELRAEVEKLGASGVALPQLAGGFEQLAAAETQAKAALDKYDSGLIKTQVLQKETTHQSERMAQTFRSQFRNVATGQASIGSLLNPRALAGFGLGGLAIGAAFQGLQHLSDGLRVTGEEATTTEGKLRNFGASLATGDVVGGLIALTKHADSADTALKKLLAKEGTSTVDLRNFAFETSQAAQATQQFADATDKAGGAAARGGGRFAGVSAAAGKTANELRRTADEATALAAAFDTSTQAAYDVEAAINAAGSAAARFGPDSSGRAIGPGAISDTNARNRAAGQAVIDQGNTLANQNAIAEANARTDAERLKVARDEQAQAKTSLERLTKGEQGYTEALVAYSQARQRADQIAQTIQDKADRDAAAAQAKREQRAAEAARKRQAAAREAAKKKKAADEAAVKEAILFASGAIKSRQNLVYDPISGFFESTDPDGKAMKKAGNKSGSASAGFSLTDLGAFAANQFSTYGSNISGRNGVLSGQDERAAFGLKLSGNLGSPLVAEARTSNGLLGAILVEIKKGNGSAGGEAAPRGFKNDKSYGNLQAERGVAMAAAYGYGVN